MRETNKNFIRHTVFKKACELTKTPVTTRQASKFRRGFGLAARFSRKAFSISNQEKIDKLLY